LIFLVILEIFFYYSHRLFHHPLLYSKVHKIHHQWTVPISISSVYCHPLEQLICNLWPIVAGPVLLGDLCGNHILSAWLWIIFTLTSTTVMHSGYHFPFMLSPQAHDFHHRRFNENYGSLGILDYIHGTSVEFRKSPYYKYHRIICTLSPVKRLILSEKSDD
jgi:methylsterol monooxygenase